MLDIVRRRRSIRRYEDRPVDAALVEQLKEAVLRAPTSRNIRPWRFVFVTDRQALVELSTAKAQWATPIAAAPLAVAVLGDERLSDCWIEDCSIAATVLQLMATDLGLGSCWIQMRGRADAEGRSAEERVREILGIEEPLRVECVVSLGYPAEEKTERPAEDLLWERVSEQ